MTLSEFTAWLDGFLDGKDSLTADQVATVQAKLALVARDWGTMPTPQFVPNLPVIPGTLPWSQPIMCGGTSGDVVPEWLKSRAISNTEQ